MRSVGCAASCGVALTAGFQTGGEILDATSKEQVDKMIKGLRAQAFAGDPWDAVLQLALKVAR